MIATRSRLLARWPDQGDGAVRVGDPGHRGADRRLPDVTLAVYASPRQTVIAGPPDRSTRWIAVVRPRTS